MPVTCAPVWQAKMSPRRQLSQERQCQACQPTPTRWPACHRPGTSFPTASITPTTSWPGTRGKVMPGHWPSLVKTSLWQTPQAWTLIRTAPGPGSGIGRSTSSRGPPGRETWATRIVAMRMSSRSPVVLRLVFGLAGITVCSAGEWSPAWRASPKASDSGPPRAQVGWLSWRALREFEVEPTAYEPRSLFLALLRDRDLFGVAGVQDHRQEAGPGLGARVPGHPVHRSRRLVERIPGLVGLDRFVVEGVLVFALHAIPDPPPPMLLRCLLFPPL